MTDATMDKSSRPEAIIEIRLGKLQQLFNSLDPSPFHDRDLDHDAEEYILGWAEEIALHLPLKLVILLPQDQLGSADQPALERSRNARKLRAISSETVIEPVSYPDFPCVY
jgi:hypothetical protein